MILLSLKERGVRRKKPLTRARLSKFTIKKLCLRETITREWVDAVNEWLLSAGWVLINAGTTYAAVKVNVVENWPRAIRKYLKAEIEQVEKGTFDFKSHEGLLKKDFWTTTTHLRGRTSNKRARTKR